MYIMDTTHPKSLHKTLGQTTENEQTLGKWGGIMPCIGG